MIVYDVGSEFVVQLDGRCIDCMMVIIFVDVLFDDDGKDLGFCERNEMFVKYLGVLIKVQDCVCIVYCFVVKVVGI